METADSEAFLHGYALGSHSVFLRLCLRFGTASQAERFEERIALAEGWLTDPSSPDR